MDLLCLRFEIIFARFVFLMSTFPNGIELARNVAKSFRPLLLAIELLLGFPRVEANVKRKVQSDH